MALILVKNIQRDQCLPIRDLGIIEIFKFCTEKSPIWNH